jgi:hypothetical protein
MTDFAKELQGKAYQLCEGLMELDDFKSWFRLAMVGKAPDEPTPYRTPAGKNPEFSDYYQTPYEPMDADMEAHHRKLMGGGDP